MAMDPSKTPLLPPPPGRTSNFVDPENRDVAEICFAVILPVIALGFVTARVYTQAKFAQKFHFDDYLSVLAMLFSIVYSITLITRLRYGFGKHMWDISLAQFNPKQYVVSFIVTALMANMIIMTSKLAILFFYRRIFGVNKMFLRLVDATSFVIFAYCFASIFEIIFSCTPVRKSWDPQTPGTCLNLKIVAIVAAALNVVTDVAVFILPMPIIWRLRLATRLKVGLSIVFTLGSSTLALSGVRLWSTIAYSNDPDSAWSIVTWDICSLFEFNALIICGCMPILKALIQRVFPRLLPESLFGTLEGSQRKSARATHSGSQEPKSGKKWIKSNPPDDMEMGCKTSGQNSAATFKSTSEEGLMLHDGEIGVVKTVMVESAGPRAR